MPQNMDRQLISSIEHETKNTKQKSYMEEECALPDTFLRIPEKGCKLFMTFMMHYGKLFVTLHTNKPSFL